VANNKLNSNRPSNGLPNSFGMKSSRSITSSEIQKFFTKQVGFDIETRSVDRFKRDILQLGFQTPTKSLFEINLQQAPGFSPLDLQHFHHRSGGLTPYYQGQISGLPALDLTKKKNFDKAVDETGRKFYRSVMAESQAQGYISKFLGTGSNVIGHNIINFEMRKLKTWMGDKSPLSMPEEYWGLIKGNAAARREDLKALSSGEITAEAVRKRDRIRQMSVYEWTVSNAKKGGSVIDTMDLAKALNAVAQERGLINAGAELSIGTNVEFLASTLLKGRKELHRASQDVAIQNTLAPRLVHYVEELKAGRTPRGLETWLKAWKDPSVMKIQSQTKAIERGIEALHGAGKTELFSGKHIVTKYSQFSEALTQTGAYAPSMKTQGLRVADYGMSPLEIFKKAEAGISSHHRTLLKAIDPSSEKILGVKNGMSLPKGLGKYAAIAGGAIAAGYLLNRSFGISGKDDDYNTIEGLKHGWFGSSRKYFTDFGSGFNLDRINKFAQLTRDPMALAEIESDIESKQSQQEVGELSDLDVMMIGDVKTLQGLNARRKQLRELKLNQYEVLVDDADTLVLNKKGSNSAPIQIRMGGIDAPETVHGDDPIADYRIGQAQPFGKESTERLKELVAGGEDLRLFVDPSQKTYGRYIGVLFKGNKNINLQLVEEGYASSLEFGSRHKDAADRAVFMAAGNKAEREGLGMWGLDFFQDWKAFSAGAGRDVTFNSFTDILRLSRNRYLAEGASEIWEDGANTEESYRYGSLYKMSNQFSGKDGQYNTIAALPHRWFGKQRKENTDFGSGYQGPSEKKPVDPTPTRWGTIAAITGIGAGAKFFWNKPIDIFGKKVDIDKLSYMGEGMDSSFLGRKNATYGDFAYNLLRRAELSLGGFPKAFSLSTVLSPSILKDYTFTVDISKKANPYSKAKKLDSRFGYGYQSYLEQLTGQKLDDVKNVTYKQGKLFGETFSGETKTLLEEARLFQRIHDPNISKSAAQFTKSYESIFNIAGIGAEHPFLIGGGKNKTQAAMRTAHAYAHETFSKYARLADDPAKAFVELFPDASERLTSTLQKVSKYIPKLGVGGEKELIAPLHHLFAKHAKRALPVLLGLPVLYGTANWMVKQVSPEDTVAGKAGITGIFAETARIAHMTYAATSEVTGLTALRGYGEEKAPGMVGFKPWLGLTLSGALTFSAGQVVANLFKEATSAPGKERYASMIAAKTAKTAMPSSISKLPGMAKEFTSVAKAGKYGALIAGTLASPFLLLGLGSEKTVDDLNEEYLGRKEVGIKKARWWEFGMTPWEGERTMYYRPNWYNKILSDATEKSIYDGEDISPIGKFFRTLKDPYWLEKKQYQDRPYPIAGSSGEDLGIFGPLYESTIGRVLKPPAYMHTDQWMGGYKSEKKQYEPSKELGGLDREAPISPYSFAEQVKQQYYSGYEAAGLRGFVTSAVKEALTGDQDLFEEKSILQSSADMDSNRRGFWDANLGGLLGMTEAYRRFNPKRPYSTEYVNPIENRMPEWMPGGDYFLNFKTGDPYSKIAEGEYRLPGRGYEARYAELEGISPEKYPLIHRYKILADVAPYSKEFRAARKDLESYQPSDYEREIFESTEKQLEEKKKTKRFREEVYEQSILGRYGSALTDIARASPLEQLTPIAPAHKLLPPTTALNSYEESIYGKEFKLWQRPIEDFVKPFFTTATNLLGIDRIPTQVQEARKIESYFDELKYIKFRRLEAMAHAKESSSRAAYYRGESSQTLVGADVYSSEFRLLAALPKREKVYFQEFMQAKPEDKEKILDLVPENMRDLYIAQWDKAMLSDLQENKLEVNDQERYNLEREIFNRMATIRSKRSAEAEILENKQSLPPDDWIGWRSDVELEDIKLKYLIQTGRDYHYYDLWDDRLKALRRKPYLEDAMEDIDPFREVGKATYQEVYKHALMSGIENPVILENRGSSEMKYNLEYNRDDEIKEHLRDLGQVI